MPRGSDLKNFLLDILFPKTCFGCGREGEWICPSCQNHLTHRAFLPITCPLCAKKTGNDLGVVCQSCRPKTNIEGIISVGAYNNEVLQKSVKTLKYSMAKDIASDLSKLLSQRLLAAALPASYENIVIVPVPLHKKRKRYRGFNQSEEIGQRLAKSSDLAYSPILARTINTRPQVDLKEKDRKKNVAGAFKLLKNDSLSGKTILIVDDVSTTGATLTECAKVLSELNPESIWGLVVARG